MKRIATLVLLVAALVFAQDSYDQLLSHWTYDPSTPLNVRLDPLEVRRGIRVNELVYSAPVGDRAKFVGANGGEVTAYAVIPDGKGPFPAVIYGHWCMPGSEMMNRKEFLEEAIVLAQSGVVSLLPDHVSVHPGFVADHSPMNEQQVAVQVQQDINLRRGMDWLLTSKYADPKRVAYVGHSCDATAGGFLSGIDKRFKAFVIMAGNLSDEVNLKSKMYQEYRQKVGPEKLDAFQAKYSWLDPGKYVPHAAPAAMFLQYATDEPFISGEMVNGYFALVSEPKKLKIYVAPHALNADATRDRIAFLAEQLSFTPPEARAVAAIPALIQPPWPKAAP